MSEVLALKEASHELFDQLTQVLASHRQDCPRLYLLTDLQLASLVASKKPAEHLNKFLHQVSILKLTISSECVKSTQPPISTDQSN